MTRHQRRWETWAKLDYGDHGMADLREDATRVGLIELTDQMRWVPQDGEGWTVPIWEITVVTPKTLFNRPAKGVALEHHSFGRVNVRATHHAPGMAVHVQQGYLNESRKSGQLRTQLMKRGAREPRFS